MLFAIAGRLRQLRRKRAFTLDELSDVILTSDFAFNDDFLQLSPICGKCVFGMVSYSHRKGPANPGTDHVLYSQNRRAG